MDVLGITECMRVRELPELLFFSPLMGLHSVSIWIVLLWNPQRMGTRKKEQVVSNSVFLGAINLAPV